ncbi:unnamed protein product [Urochloa decumbens]|uniref:Protein LURP-one-related 11-like n=1 Tax=Urochloa decumbens TaxID=240449 RepID=A0ABC9FZ67_9POAL
MAPRVHSSPASASTSSQKPACTGEQRKVFTVWMKSLVLNGHGCTVYDSGGGIVYRVDNYGSRCSGSVCLMDLDGTVVLNVVKKKLSFGRWDGYKGRGQKREPRPWFTVTRPVRPFRWSHCRSVPSSCEFRCDTTGQVMMRYTIVADECGGGSGRKQGCRIVDEATGVAVAEVKRKVTPSGVALGEDVLSLVVEPGADLSLVVGLVLVYGLMNRTM